MPPPAENDPFLICPSNAPSLEFTQRHAYERPQPPADLRNPPKRAAGAHRGTHAPAPPAGTMTVGWRGAAGGGGGGGGGSRSGWSSSSWTSWTAWTWAATWSSQWQPSEGRLWMQTSEAMPEYVSLESYALGLMSVFALGAVVGAIGPMQVMQSLCGLWSCAPANTDPADYKKDKGESSDDFRALLADEPEADPPYEKTEAVIVDEPGPACPAAVPDGSGRGIPVDAPGEDPAAMPGLQGPPHIEGVAVPAVPTGDNENGPDTFVHQKD